MRLVIKVQGTKDDQNHKKQEKKISRNTLAKKYEFNSNIGYKKKTIGKNKKRADGE